MEAYVLDKSAAPAFDPINDQYAASIFGLAFSGVLTCFVLARMVGSAINMLRR